MTKQPMKYYILANGDGTRWHNYKGVPKPLIEIDGETLLHRMIGLLHDNGVEKENIFICGRFEDDGATTIMTKSPTKREVFEEVANLAQGPFTILYGDCYYSATIIYDIVHRPINKFDEYLNPGGNEFTGCPWCEGYAHRCEDWEWWRDEMHELNSNTERITLYKDWYIHFWLLGFKEGLSMNRFVGQDCLDADHDILWHDETDDFDYPSDLDRFCKYTNHTCTNGGENETTE